MGAMTTGIIRYNIKDRQRKFSGDPRNFDVPSLCAVINSPGTQESVKKRDMLGYFSHWFRERFGLRPPGSVIHNGKVVEIVPAIVTTYLKAYPDGTIEHEAEFLDTAPGQVSARMHASKTGGFSSAINAVSRNGMDCATGFFGFDYVDSPNYHTNRGYVLDSAVSMSGDQQSIGVEVAVFDCVQTINSANATFLALLDAAERDNQRAHEVIAQLVRENEDYQSMLSRTGQKVLDGAHGFARPGQIARSATNAFAANIQSFQTSDLAQFAEEPADRTNKNEDAAQKSQLRRFGIVL